jgi:membrane carboxypeptidase/penicillin-binding protein
LKVIGDLRREELDIARRLESIRHSTDFSLPLDMVIAALVAGEDRRFYTHQGFDVVGMLSAAWGYLRTGKIRGASTIEMQLVRTLRSRYELTVARKISEIYLAHRIAKIYQKSDVARFYLVVAYFGWKANGIRQVALRLKLDLRSLDIEAASHLVALLKYPLPKEPTEAILGKVIARANYIAGRLK